MEGTKITFEEKLNNNISYYESMIDLLESIKKPTIEEKIKIKIYKNVLQDTKNLKRLYNYERIKK